MSGVESIKVVLLGESGVGKSSIALRFVTDEFRPYSEATIGASFMSKSIAIPASSAATDEDSTPENNNNCENHAKGKQELKSIQQQQQQQRNIGFKIWDTAGQEKYRSLAPMYYRGSNAAILVYDITKPGSFAALQDWADELRQNGPADLVLVVCGNKSDLEEGRLVDRSIGEAYADDIGALYIETSAKAGEGVENMFVAVAKKVPPPIYMGDEYLIEDAGLDLGKSSDAKQGEPLFSSHMIDLSEEPIEENIGICKDYLARMSKIGMLLEMELGITGGEEDGVNNEDVALEDLYSKPEEIFQVYDELTPISDMFTVAAAFGNVHGVYSPGNVQLEPKILTRAQAYISEKLGDKAPADLKPVKFVFHGGSGSDVTDIQEAIGYGVIKMNIDTDTQWSYWEGIKKFENKFHDYLQGQIGNPEGPEKPNKKYYDPRECMRAAETNTVERLDQCFADLKCVNILGLGEVSEAENVLEPRRGGLPV